MKNIKDVLDMYDTAPEGGNALGVKEMDELGVSLLLANRRAMFYLEAKKNYLGSRQVNLSSDKVSGFDLLKQCSQASLVENERGEALRALEQLVDHRSQLIQAGFALNEFDVQFDVSPAKNIWTAESLLETARVAVVTHQPGKAMNIGMGC